MRTGPAAAPNDVVATAAGELAGTTTSADYGPPYNTRRRRAEARPAAAAEVGGVRIPVDSANDLVLAPLPRCTGDPAAAAAPWPPGTRGRADQRTAWATRLRRRAGQGARTATRRRSPPATTGRCRCWPASFLALARAGASRAALTSSGTFYGSDPTRSLLLLADGAYLEDQARAQQLGGDQWGMMNETGNYPGQPWMWLYTFWYQVTPFSTSDNADALVWGLMMLLSLGLLLLPFIPGLRSHPAVDPGAPADLAGLLPAPTAAPRHRLAGATATDGPRPGGRPVPRRALTAVTGDGLPHSPGAWPLSSSRRGDDRLGSPRRRVGDRGRTHGIRVLPRRTRVAVALGGGAARGYAHIGILEVLEERGYDVVSIAGSSMGALVGGLYAAGGMEVYADWVRGLTHREVLRMYDLSPRAPGAIRAERIFARVSDILGDVRIEDLPSTSRRSRPISAPARSDGSRTGPSTPRSGPPSPSPAS